METPGQPHSRRHPAATAGEPPPRLSPNTAEGVSSNEGARRRGGCWGSTVVRHGPGVHSLDLNVPFADEQTGQTGKKLSLPSNTDARALSGVLTLSRQDPPRGRAMPGRAGPAGVFRLRLLFSAVKPLQETRTGLCCARRVLMHLAWCCPADSGAGLGSNPVPTTS